MDTKPRKLDNPLLGSRTTSNATTLSSLGSSLKSTSLNNPNLSSKGSLVNPALNSSLSSLSSTVTKRRSPVALPQNLLSSLSKSTKRLELSNDSYAPKQPEPESDSKPFHQDNEALKINLEELPVYKFDRSDYQKFEEKETVNFFKPDTYADQKKYTEEELMVENKKVRLINAVSTSLLRSPNFKEKSDPGRNQLCELAKEVIPYDAEFILKLALYTRNDLFIRSTANFLLAYASYYENCRPYLKKYFKAAVNLPSDWIEVAEIYQYFDDSKLNHHSLPTALRRVMKDKFPDFDEYQLAKYNKNKKPSPKKSTKKSEDDEAPKRDKEITEQVAAYASGDDDDDEDELVRKSFTLKQLIRLLHISDPVKHVMCLLGKKYPDSLDGFNRSRLPGMWEEELACSRMKLPTPETWETQISMRGNKAEVWEELVEHQKLPYMAMLRNLRNIILANVSLACHKKVLNYLTNENAVIRSKQFPFRFLSAYQAIEDLVNKTAFMNKFTKRNDPKHLEKSSNWWDKARHKKLLNKIQDCDYDVSCVKKYLDGIKKAVTISTNHNIPPIKGFTVIVMSNISNRQQSNKFLKVLPVDMQKIYKASAMLATMCLAKCEHGQLVLCMNSWGYMNVELKSDNILENVNRIIEEIENDGTAKGGASEQTVQYEKLLHSLLYSSDYSKHKVDNFILLTGKSGEASEKENTAMRNFLDLYRQRTNPDLLYVRVNVSGSSMGADDSMTAGNNVNDIFLSGFSDQILRLIAERGNGGQLTSVEKIDQKYDLKALPNSIQYMEDTIETEEQKLPLPSYTLKWRTLQVFISSTFLDMQAERDLLVRFVFPELQARAKARLINVYDVDLRWGISETESNSNRLMEMCLTQLSKCQLFIGILGMKYGSIPNSNELRQNPEFLWLNDYKEGSSATELEMHAAALCTPQNFTNNAFFFIRDSTFIQDVPSDYVDLFVEGDVHKAKRLEDLKERVKSSGLEVYEGYPCKWGGVYNGQPIVKDLECFGQRVLDNIWNAIEKVYPVEEVESELEQEAHIHNAHAEKLAEEFVGRSNLLTKVDGSLDSSKRSGIVSVVGRPGSGKSALLAYLHKKWKNSSKTIKSIVYFVGLTPGNDNVAKLLKYILHQITIVCNKTHVEIPNSVSSLLESIPKPLEYCYPLEQIYIFLDGVDHLSYTQHEHTLDWLLALKKTIGVTFVCSTTTNSEASKILLDHAKETVEVPPLDLSDRNAIVNTNLAKHSKALDGSLLYNLLRSLTTKRDANLPLYLDLACQQLRYFGLHGQMSRKVSSLGNTLEQLVKGMLTDMEADVGADLVKYSLSLIVLSKQDLRKQELLDLLNMHLFFGGQKVTFEDVISVSPPVGFGVRPSSFVRLMQLMERLLNSQYQNSSDSLIFAHDDVKKIVMAHYVQRLTTDVVVRLHTLLAGYFMKTVYEAIEFGNHVNSLAHSHAMTSLPYHLMSAGCYDELAVLLTNLQFIRAKLCFCPISKIIEDCQANVKPINKSVEKKRVEFRNNKGVLEVEQFLIENAYYLSNPTMLLQLALQQLSLNTVYDQAYEIVDNPSNTWNHLLTEAKTSAFYDRRAVCKSTIGRWGSAKPTCIAVPANCNEVISGCADGQVHLYNSVTNSKIKTFVGHSSSITALAMIGQQCFCSASKDNTISIWNIERGLRLHTLKCHTRTISDISVDGNAMTIASVGLDRLICIWSVSDGRLISKLTSERNPLNCVQFFPSKQEILVGGWDYVVKSWDLINMKVKFRLYGHYSSVQSLAIHKNEEIAASSSFSEVLVWSLQHRCPIQDLQLQSNRLLMSPSGDRLYVAEKDKPSVSVYGCQGMNVFQEHRVGFWNSKVVGVAQDEHRLFAAYKSGHVLQFSITHAYGQAIFHRETVEEVSKSEITTFDMFDDELFIGTADGNVMCTTSNFVSSHPYLAKLKGPNQSPVSAVHGSNGQTFVAYQNGLFSFFTHFGDNCRKDKVKEFRPEVVKEAHVGGVTHMKLYKGYLCTSGANKAVNIYDVSDFRLLYEVKDLHTDPITAMDFNRRGLFTISSDRVVKVITKRSLKEGKLAVETFCTTTVADPTMLKVLDKHLVIGTINGFVHILKNDGTNLTNFKFLSEAGIPAYHVYENEDHVSLAKSESHWNDNTEEKTQEARQRTDLLPSLSIVVANGGNVSVYLEVQMKKLASLDGHTAPVADMRVMPDDTVVTMATDDTVKLWTLKSDFETCGPLGGDMHPNPVSDVKIGCCNVIVSISRDDDNLNSHLKFWQCNGIDDSLKKFQVWPTMETKVIKDRPNCDGASIGFLTGSNRHSHASCSYITHGMLGFSECTTTKKASTYVTINDDGHDSYDYGLVTSFAFDCYEGCDFVIVGTEKGYVVAYEMATDKWAKGQTKIFAEQIHDVAILKISMTKKDKIRYIYSADSIGEIIESTIPVGSRKWSEETCSCRPVTYTAIKTKGGYLQHSEVRSLPTAIYSNESLLLVGDNDGTLQLFDLINTDVSMSRQVHSERVTSCVMLNDCIFTASYDGYIKVWLYNKDKEPSLSQYVQHKCKTAVTCLDSVMVGEHIALIVAGDIVGNVYFLRWLPLFYKFVQGPNPYDQVRM